MSSPPSNNASASARRGLGAPAASTSAASASLSGTASASASASGGATPATNVSANVSRGPSVDSLHPAPPASNPAVKYRILAPPPSASSQLQPKHALGHALGAGTSPGLSPSRQTPSPAAGAGSAAASAPASPTIAPMPGPAIIAPTLGTAVGQRVPLRSTTAKLTHPNRKTVLLPDSDDPTPIPPNHQRPPVAASVPTSPLATTPVAANFRTGLVSAPSTTPPSPSPAPSSLPVPTIASPDADADADNAASIATSSSLNQPPLVLPSSIPTDRHSVLDDLMVHEIARDSPIVDPIMYSHSPPENITHMFSQSSASTNGPGAGRSSSHSPPRRNAAGGDVSGVSDAESDDVHVLGPRPPSPGVAEPRRLSLATGLHRAGSPHPHNGEHTGDGRPESITTPRPPSQRHLEHIQEISSSAGARTVAEHMAKEDRTWMPRCTAYVTASRYRFNDLITFLVTRHKVQVRAFDECLYASYPQFCHSPLYATPLVDPATQSTTDAATAAAVGSTSDDTGGELRKSKSLSHSHLLRAPFTHPTLDTHTNPMRAMFPTLDPVEQVAPIPLAHPILPYGEVAFFEYGVTVMWGMTAKEEQWLLGEIRQFHASEAIPRVLSSRVADHDADMLAAAGTGSPPDESTSLLIHDTSSLMSDPDSLYDEDNMVTEEFHFQYMPNGRPRIFNDIITLRDGNHLTKVTISHGIAQSCKLLLFEIKMENTLQRTRNIPKSLAQTGTVALTPREVTVLTGHLYQLRMDLNLISNVLDVPDMFWTTPGWQPLYRAVQKYLEIPQRSKTLNLRAQVLSDLLDMLSSHITTAQMDWMTWVVIIMIAISVVVLALEIVMKALKVGAH
ncbi:hypothetical protein BCR44DRAFT_160331 [Catenaria anguillulae PL171]|uniref:DUF155 domain-containing protein n=1 Tax=Catenaria anguillulae PL171 TaxID=765915 RepID=A0A1Y2HTG9_9FUNG|nr:hypothetical protein BCR44DRAFT_160331 [Catenaria anguillulae PL171]